MNDNRWPRLKVIGGEVVEAHPDLCDLCIYAAKRRPRRAAPFHCSQCGNHIGKTRTACLMDIAGTVWCMSCRLGDDSRAWWDTHKPLVTGTRSGIRRLLATHPPSELSDLTTQGPNA